MYMEVKYVQSVGVNRPAPIEPKLDKAVMLGYSTQRTAASDGSYTRV